jgi:hypothetical protein
MSSCGRQLIKKSRLLSVAFARFLMRVIDDPARKEFFSAFFPVQAYVGFPGFHVGRVVVEGHPKACDCRMDTTEEKNQTWIREIYRWNVHFGYE